MNSISFIGAGRLGGTLALAFEACGLPVTMVASRNNSKSQAISSQSSHIHAVSIDEAATAEIVFLTVSDDAIQTVANSISWQPQQYVVHCSGATELSALDAAQKAGAIVGGFHPLQMFVDMQTSRHLLPGTTVGIEGHSEIVSVLQHIAAQLDMIPMVVPAGARALYHGGSLFMSSFLLSMMAESVRVWKTFGMTEAQTLQALLPLAQGALVMAQKNGLAASVTGPISRGDDQVIAQHMLALSALGEKDRALYVDMSQRQMALMKKTGKFSAQQIEVLEQLLKDA